MPKRYSSRVIVSPHARARYVERHGSGRLTSERVRGILLNILALGVEAEDLVVAVPVGNNLVALCTPLPGVEGGGWQCFTVMGADWRKNLKDLLREKGGA